MTNIKQKVAKGAVWTLCEKLSSQAVQFVVGMILARLLTPTDYGTVGLAGIFFTITGCLVNVGFGSALIQKKDADQLDYNSVFYFSLVMSVVAYLVMFFMAPFIADFYEVPELKWIVRVSAVSFIYNAINSIQGAELTKKMLFHLSFRISLISTFTSAIVGVTLAFLGFGVWAFVLTSLVTGFVGVISRWYIIAWRPQLMFSFARLKPLFSYGWKMAASGLLDSLCGQLNGLLIGKFYTRADLAYVDKGRSLPSTVMGEVNATVGRVSFPALVQLQDDKIKLRDAMRRMMVCSTFLVMPAMVGVAACAHSELRLLYGSQWTSAAPYMMCACFTFALWPFHTINLQGIQALGRSDIFLKLEIIKKVVLVTVNVVMLLNFSVLAFVVVGAFVMGPFGVMVNSWPNRKLLDYPIGMQLRDVLPTVGLCCVEAAVVFGVDWVFNSLGFGFASTGSLWSLVAVLILQLVTGALTYLSLAYVFRVKPMGEYARMFCTALGSRFPRLCACLMRRFGG